MALDIKGTLRWKGWPIVHGLRRLSRIGAGRYIYRPTIHELRDPAAMDALAWWVYDRYHTTLYVDELYGYLEPFGGGVAPGLHACLTRGRERGVEVWCSTQRPYRIPLSVLSESEHMYVFRLKVHEDRKRVEEVTGLDETLIAQLPKHYFYWCPQDNDVRGPLRLQLHTIKKEVKEHESSNTAAATAATVSS